MEDVDRALELWAILEAHGFDLNKPLRFNRETVTFFDHYHKIGILRNDRKVLKVDLTEEQVNLISDFVHGRT